MPTPQAIEKGIRSAWFAARYAELDAHQKYKEYHMPKLSAVEAAFPEASKETTPRLRDFNGKTVTIVDAKMETREVNGKPVAEPFVFLTGGVKVLGTNACVKKAQRLFTILDAEVKKGDRKALAAIGIPENTDLNKPETWRFLECQVKAQDRGVQIS